MYLTNPQSLTNIGYTYNLVGSPATLTYPSGRVLTYKYEAAGRPSTVRDLTNGINYVTGVTSGSTYNGEDGNGACYAPNGVPGTMVNGYTPSFQGITTSNSYNKRWQPVILSASAPSQTVLSLSYDFHLGTGDNGNVFAITNGRDSLRPLVGSATYTYDPLNRLQSAATTGSDCTVVNGFSKNWGESFSIDAWGNLLSITPTRCSAENLSVTVGTKNWVTTSGYSYDAAGNMTLDGQSHSPVYDGENRIKTVAGVNYTYDGDGKRVKKDTGKLYWTGIGSDPLDESDLSGNFTEEYVFFNGKRTARVDLPSGAVHYYFSDHLGSADVVTNATGSTIEQESDYYPYGGERVITAGVNNYKFTGKERDSESGSDDFGARHYGFSMGRWLIPDWSAKADPVPYAKLEDPQTLNLYSYLRNNPMNGVDADGHADPKGCGGFACEKGDDTSQAQNQIPLGGAPPAPGVPPQAFDDAHVNNMTVRQVGNVVANENRDVTPGTSTPQQLQDAKTAQANAVMNADYQYGANRQNVVPTAPATDPNHLANTPQGQQALQAARTAFIQQNTGKDPTGNRVFFNNRWSDSTAPRTINGHQQTVFQQYGPFSVGGGNVWTLIYNNP